MRRLGHGPSLCGGGQPGASRAATNEPRQQVGKRAPDDRGAAANVPCQARIRRWGRRSPKSFRTPELLAGLGLSYVLDRTNDDQPYRLNLPGMLSVPYSVELNDIGLFIGKHLSGPDFVRIVKDQLDQLQEDAADGGRVMTLALHPFVIGQAFRYT